MMNGNEVYIVTGATGGIGRAITEALARRGVRLVLACRNVGKALGMMSDAGSKRCEVLPLDLSSLRSVREFVDEVVRRRYAVKALINNAGTMPGQVIMTCDGYEEATQTNFVATALLTSLLLPVIVSDGSVVFTTSMTRHMVKLRADWQQRAIEHHGRFTTYGRSKLMITHFALDLALERPDIKVNCSDPGIVDSSIITMDNRLVDYLSDRLFRPLISTPRQGAEPVLAALDSNATGCIFTRRGVRPIPQSYLNDPLHGFPAATVRSLL